MFENLHFINTEGMWRGVVVCVIDIFGNDPDHDHRENIWSRTIRGDRDRDREFDDHAGH